MTAPFGIPRFAADGRSDGTADVRSCASRCSGSCGNGPTARICGPLKTSAGSRRRAAVLGLILVGAIGLSISDIVHAVAAARNLELGAREALGLIVSALALIFSALMAAALVINWYTARKELRAEREQLSNPPAARRPAAE